MSSCVLDVQGAESIRKLAKDALFESSSRPGAKRNWCSVLNNARPKQTIFTGHPRIAPRRARNSSAWMPLIYIIVNHDSLLDHTVDIVRAHHRFRNIHPASDNER